MNRDLNNRNYAAVFRALGDPHRLQILGLLLEKERNAGELLELVDVVQSTLSHHMKALCEAGLVIPRKSGKWTYYTVSKETVEAAEMYLRSYRTEKAQTEETKVQKEKLQEKPEARKETTQAEPEVRKEKTEKPEHAEEKTVKQIEKSPEVQKKTPKIKSVLPNPEDLADDIWENDGETERKTDNVKKKSLKEKKDGKTKKEGKEKKDGKKHGKKKDSKKKN